MITVLDAAVSFRAIPKSAPDLPRADPLRLGTELAAELTTLADFVCAAPLDAALHDAWATTLGLSAYQGALPRRGIR